MKGLATEVVVASYNSKNINIMVLISSYFFSLNLISYTAEGRAIETTVALPECYRGGAPVVVSAQLRRISDDPSVLSVFAGLSWR